MSFPNLFQAGLVVPCESSALMAWSLRSACRREHPANDPKPVHLCLTIEVYDDFKVPESEKEIVSSLLRGA